MRNLIKTIDKKETIEETTTIEDEESIEEIRQVYNNLHKVVSQ